MAEQITGIIEEVVTETLSRNDGTGTFEMTTVTVVADIPLKDNKITAKGFTNKLGDLPAVGDTVTMNYQPVKSGKTVRNSLLSISIITKSESAPQKTTIETPRPQVTTRKISMSDLTFFKLHGKTSFAHIKEPDTKGKFPTNKYKLDLIIDDDTASKLSKLGVLVKDKKDERGKFVTLKSKYQPIVLDNNGNQLTDIPLIGNGSKVTVTVKLYDNKAPNGGKKCLGMNKLEINELVTFTAPNLLDIDE